MTLPKKCEFALTVWQPWAWAIVAGYKDVENRDWKPSEELIGKWIAIHAGRKVDEWAIPAVRAMTGELPIMDRGIIGVARLDAVVTEFDSRWRNDSRYGFVFSNARRLRPVTPCLGLPKFWRLPKPLYLDFTVYSCRLATSRSIR